MIGALPPSRHPTPEQMAVRLRVSAVIGVLLVLGSLAYFGSSGHTFWQAAMLVAPLAAIVAVTVIGMSRGMDTLTRWFGYVGGLVIIAALVLGYATTD